jgi:hypothetical protein
MCTAIATDRMAEIDRKLDFIVEEIANLKALRNSAEDLAADLSLVGKSAMRDAVEAFGTADLRPRENCPRQRKPVRRDGSAITERS